MYNTRYMAPINDWISVDEAAKLAGYHPEYVRELLRTGMVRGQKWVNTWMVSREDLLRHRREHSNKTDEEAGEG